MNGLAVYFRYRHRCGVFERHVAAVCSSDSGSRRNGNRWNEEGSSAVVVVVVDAKAGADGRYNFKVVRVDVAVSYVIGQIVGEVRLERLGEFWIHVEHGPQSFELDALQVAVGQRPDVAVGLYDRIGVTEIRTEQVTLTCSKSIVLSDDIVNQFHY